MAEITITVDDEEIARIAVEKIAAAMVTQYHAESREAKRGILQGVDKAVKDYIYTNKDAIIEKCVARASAELARKGLPKLLERMAAPNE